MVLFREYYICDWPWRSARGAAFRSAFPNFLRDTPGIMSLAAAPLASRALFIGAEIVSFFPRASRPAWHSARNQ